MYPDVFSDLVEDFKLLPGVGEKTAERFAYSLIDKNEEDILKISEDIVNFKKKIKHCEICGHLTDRNICNICSDKTRDNSIICIVENSKSVFMFEKTNNYSGLYHVINGLISPIEDIGPENINLDSLINKRINDNLKEIIIALNPSIEGETTSLYIQKKLEGKNIKISRLSYGIPIGSDIEYLDPIMLTKTLEDRKIIS
jgi:recombination protein RecR